MMLKKAFWGIVLIVFGGLLLLDHADVIDFDLGRMWPLFIIAAGVGILLRSGRKHAGVHVNIEGRQVK